MSENKGEMAQTLSSFQQLVDFLGTKGLESEKAVPVAERFMGAVNVDFDADGNFAPMAVDYDAGSGELKKA
jgi:hypothetical protein